jgi:hypothetical protein
MGAKSITIVRAVTADFEARFRVECRKLDGRAVAPNQQENPCVSMETVNENHGLGKGIISVNK